MWNNLLSRDKRNEVHSQLRLQCVAFLSEIKVRHLELNYHGKKLIIENSI